jgi:4-amino-4-deoxy-L-arabinose transferase-like glycosyltransferase
VKTLTAPVMARGRLVLTGFHVSLIGIGAVGLVVRVVASLLARNHVILGDAFVYEAVGRALANGDGMEKLGQPTAEHPPMWELVLGLANLLGINSTISHRLIGALLGTVTVVLLGLLGRRLGGNTVGLVAAGIAAVYPPLWAADTSLMSESLYGAILTGALLAATYRRPVLLGVLLALATLSRVEALGLVVLLAVPLFWRQWRKLAVTVAACAVVLAPWTIRNLVTFDKPVLMSTNSGSTWIGTNCDATYYGDLIGSWDYWCNVPPLAGEDESAYSARETRLGQQYMLDHVGRVPKVLAARFLRMLDMWSVDQSVVLNELEGRPGGYTRAGIPAFWVLLPLAAAGAVILARRRDSNVVILAAPVVLAAGAALMLYGSTRLRFSAEPALVVLGAVALVSLASRVLRRRRGSRSAPAADPPAPVDALPGTGSPA